MISRKTISSLKTEVKLEEHTEGFRLSYKSPITESRAESFRVTEVSSSAEHNLERGFIAAK